MLKKAKRLLRLLDGRLASISPLVELSKRQERALVDRLMSDGAVFLPDAGALRALALTSAPATGLLLEFGVFDGTSIRFLAERTERTVHGFDTFTGLPRDDGIAVWKRHRDRGTFDVNGKLPNVPANVMLYAGLFEETLPRFLQEHEGPAALIHIDCDLYSSTRAVFSALGERIVAGTIILFDEYFNYPGWQFGEHRAFQELVKERKLEYTALGVASADPTRQEFGHYARLGVRVTKAG
jgi:methyltransferase family protein